VTWIALSLRRRNEAKTLEHLISPRRVAYLSFQQPVFVSPPPFVVLLACCTAITPASRTPGQSASPPWDKARQRLLLSGTFAPIRNAHHRPATRPTRGLHRPRLILSCCRALYPFAAPALALTLHGLANSTRPSSTARRCLCPSAARPDCCVAPRRMRAGASRPPSLPPLITFGAVALLPR
jgi:hypothetical protein